MLSRIKNFETFIGEQRSDKIYYHGSNNEFTVFDLHSNKAYREFGIPVWFFTEDKEYAKTYGKYLYSVKLNVSNTFVTLNKKHYKMFLEYLKFENKTPSQIDEILDEQFFKGLPYWTCEDAYYAAVNNGFDSILIQEELEKEIMSIGVFNKADISIIH